MYEQHDDRQTDALTRYGHWTVLAADDSGKRITCRCRCGEIRVVALAALQNGSCTSCGCRPMSPAQREELRADRARHRADCEAAR
jgi:hypothetical protein